MSKNSGQTIKEEVFNILRVLSSKKDISQRGLSKGLGVSLGKINYLLKSLVGKGYLKIKSFSSKGAKMQKVKYILTPKGAKEMMGLTLYFLKLKEREYDRIKAEWEVLKKKDMVAAITEELSLIGKNREN